MTRNDNTPTNDSVSRLTESRFYRICKGKVKNQKKAFLFIKLRYFSASSDSRRVDFEMGFQSNLNASWHMKYIGLPLAFGYTIYGLLNQLSRRKRIAALQGKVSLAVTKLI